MTKNQVVSIRVIPLILSKKDQRCHQRFTASVAIITFLLVTLMISFNFAQDDHEDLLEALEDVESAEVSYGEVLADLQRNPLDINRAGVSELLQIPFLSVEQAQSIVNIRRQGAISGMQILVDGGLSAELTDALQPYIRFTSPRRTAGFDYRLKAHRARYLPEGYQEQRYHNPLYLGQRLKWQRGNFRGSFLWEKDAGESSWSDFGSFNIGYESNRFAILLGDYNLGFGQGLLFSSGFGAMPIAGSTQPFRERGLRVRPKTSMEENRFLRGFAVTVRPAQQWSLTMGASAHQRDARADSSNSRILSLSASGYHRTETELGRKDLFEEKLIFASMQFYSETFNFATLLSRSTFSHELLLAESPVTQTTTGSLSYGLRKSAFSAGGEISLAGKGHPALQNFLLLKNRHLLWGILGYFHHPEYATIHGSRFGSLSTAPGNRRGHFISLRVKSQQGTTIAGYLHGWQDAIARKDFTRPQKSINFELTQKIGNIRLAFRHSKRLRTNGPAIQQRIDLRISPIKGLQISQRVVKAGKGEDGSGYAGYQEIRLKKKNLNLQLRWSQFDLREAGTVYEYEPELPGGFRNIALSDRGSKWYFQAAWEPNNALQMAIKYRGMVYPDRTSLGAGADEIADNQRGQFFFYLGLRH